MDAISVDSIVESLALVVPTVLGLHYGYLVAHYDDIFGLSLFKDPPPPPHPCVQCQQLSKTLGVDPDKRYLPLSFCGYGPSNFTWVEYHGTESNPFHALGMPEGHTPSIRQVHQREMALKELWNPDECLDRPRAGRVGTGLKEDQLTSIHHTLWRIRDHIDKLTWDRGSAPEYTAEPVVRARKEKPPELDGPVTQAFDCKGYIWEAFKRASRAFDPWLETMSKWRAGVSSDKAGEKAEATDKADQQSAPNEQMSKDQVAVEPETTDLKPEDPESFVPKTKEPVLPKGSLSEQQARAPVSDEQKTHEQTQRRAGSQQEKDDAASFRRRALVDDVHEAFERQRIWREQYYGTKEEADDEE